MKAGLSGPPAGSRSASSTAEDEEVAAMICDHNHAINCALVAGLVRSVRLGRQTPEQAVARLVRLCPCGQVDVDKAERVLRTMLKFRRKRAVR